MEVIARKGYTIDELTNSMKDDQYRKALEFYKFPVNITKFNNGVLAIERKS